MSPPEEPFKIDGATVMRPRWSAARAFAVVAAATVLPAALVFALMPSAPGAGAWALGFYACIFTGIFAWRRSRRVARLGYLTVRASTAGLEVEGRLVARRDTLASGAVTPLRSGGGAVVRLLERGAFARVLEVKVPSVEEGQRLLAALGLDVAHAVATATSIPKWWRWIMLGYLGGPAVAGLLSPFAGAGAARGIAPLFAPAIGVALSILLAFALRRRVVVGADGIAIERLGARRFIPLRDVQEASIHPRRAGTVQLELASGESIRLEMQRRGLRLNQNALEEAATLKERIEEALAAAATGGATAPEALLAARPEGPMSAWVARLRKGAQTETTFREAGLPEDRLWATVEDVKAEPWTRAAAAVALSADDRARPRLRVAAGSTADAKLRVALEAAAASDEAEMAEALAALDEERDAVERGLR